MVTPSNPKTPTRESATNPSTQTQLIRSPPHTIGQIPARARGSTRICAMRCAVLRYLPARVTVAVFLRIFYNFSNSSSRSVRWTSALNPSVGRRWGEVCLKFRGLRIYVYLLIIASELRESSGRCVCVCVCARTRVWLQVFLSVCRASSRWSLFPP